MFIFASHYTLPLSSLIFLTIVPDPNLGNRSGKPTLVFEGKVGDGRNFISGRRNVTGSMYRSGGQRARGLMDNQRGAEDGLLCK